MENHFLIVQVKCLGPFQLINFSHKTRIRDLNLRFFAYNRRAQLEPWYPRSGAYVPYYAFSVTRLAQNVLRIVILLRA